MRILIDEAIWGADRLFHDLGEVRTFAGRSLTPSELRDADALIVRSVTHVGPDLLADSKIRFVGSAVSGEDHLEIEWLRQQGIHVATAAGCNTRTVAEYVLASLLLLAERHRFELAEKTVGIIGVGRIGSLVARWCAALGIPTLLCDPPRAISSGDVGFLQIEEVFHRADIITLHVPLTRDGPHATSNLINEKLISACKNGLFFINTSRGEVVDESAIIDARTSGRIAGAIIDVWRNEPRINRNLLEAAEIATPHIAGYSARARQRAAEMIHQSLSQFLGVTAPNKDESADLHRFISAQSAKSVVPVTSRIRWGVLRHHVRSCCDIVRYDRELRSGNGNLDASAFDRIRREAASRKEFPDAAPLADLGTGEAHRYAEFGFPLASR